MSQSKKLSTKQIVFSAASIGVATVLANFVKLPSLPFGGSVTFFSMFFVALPGLLFGPTTGICAAVAHGLIQFISNPYAIHPLQVLLDYPVAFGALGLSGFFCNKKRGMFVGYLVGVLGRFFVASLSGAIFFTTYVGYFNDDLKALWAGIVYNMSYIFPEAVITLMILLVPSVQKGLKYIKNM